jgi:DNA repair protein RadA/Sms
VAHAAARLREAAKLGFTTAIVPQAVRDKERDTPLKLVSLNGLADLVAAIASRAPKVRAEARIHRQEA